MKNFFNLGFVVLLLVVLGCSCPNLKDLNLDERGASTPSSSNSTPSNSSPFETNSNTANTKPAGSSSSAVLTMEKYNRLKNGMSYTEAVEILGSEGEELSSSEVGKFKNVTYKWAGENYSFVIATFQNDKLLFKSQANVK